MFFIGTGALLRQALNQCMVLGISVDGVCCPVADRLVNKYKKFTENIILTDCPSSEIRDIEKLSKDGVVFSINNKHILSDKLLKSDLRFYNIHNGLVQNYRGIAEVCIFAAICKREKIYGVSLQHLLPGEVVDGGAVVSQMSIPLLKSDDFEKVFAESLILCSEIFKLNAIQVLNNALELTHLPLSPKTYSFKDMPNLIRRAPLECLTRAKSLGNYAALLPRLNKVIRQVEL